MSARIAVVVFAYYPRDPRVRRETEALVEAGHRVDVICLKSNGEPDRELVGGASVPASASAQTRRQVPLLLVISLFHLAGIFHFVHPLYAQTV